MRAPLLIVSVLLLSFATRAQEAPPPPPPPLEEPAPPPPAEEVPPLTPADDAPKPIEPAPANEPDFVPAPAPRKDKKPGEPAPDEVSIGFGGDACWGSALGCAGGGCLPGAGTALGAGILISTISAGIAEGGCGGVVLVLLGAVYGIAIGAPSAILLGPCASGAAVAGGVTAAIINDRDVGPVLLGSIPGIAAALLGTGGVIGGLAVLGNTSGDFTVPLVLLGVGTGLSLLAGPATVAGIAIADGMDDVEKPTDKDKKPVPKPEDPKKDEGTSTVAMRY